MPDIITLLFAVFGLIVVSIAAFGLWIGIRRDPYTARAADLTVTGDEELFRTIK